MSSLALDQAQTVSLRGLITLVGDLANLVADSIGPHGKAVMINIHSPKQIVVTKNGLDILEAIRGRQHPLVDKILDMVASHISRFGDGTKRVLVMLNHFLRALERQQPLQSGLEVKWRTETLAQVRRFRHRTFALVLNNLRGPQVKKISVWNELEDVLRYIVKGFMSTRFPPASADILSNLLFENFMKPHLEAVLESASDQQDPTECIKTCMIELSQNIYKKVLLGINQPVSNSSVLPSGFYLSQNLPNTISSNVNSRFIIWLARRDELEENDDNTNVVIKDGTMMSELSGWKFLKWKSETFRAFVLRLKSFQVNFIIKVNGLKDHEKSICQELEMAVIEYVDREEAVDLASEADVLVLNGSVYDNLQVVDEKFIGQTTTPANEVRLGRHFYTKLTLPEKDDVPRVPHIFICGMTQSSAEQYSKALAQCMRLLATSLTRSSKCIMAIPEEESPNGSAEIIKITSLFVTDGPNNSKWQSTALDSFEHGLIKALNIQLTSSTEAVKELDVILALRKTLEALVSDVASKYETCSRKCPLQLNNLTTTTSAPYPLDSAVEQINTVLDITEMLLSIERICSVKRRIKDVITKDCDTDSD